MAMHRKSMLAAALVGALVIGTPALARHGGGGGGGGCTGRRLDEGRAIGRCARRCAQRGSIDGREPSERQLRSVQWRNALVREPAGSIGHGAASGQWRSSRIAGDFDRHGHHHRHHHGGFFPFGVFASGDYGYYDDYYYDYPYDDSYEDCYIRHVRIHGHWVRQRYCEY